MLINLRNALMSGKRLPYDAEVEYIESTGTQWIDTEVKPKAGLTSVELLFNVVSLASSARGVFGSRNSTNPSDKMVYNVFTGTSEGTNRFRVDWSYYATSVPYSIGSYALSDTITTGVDILAQLRADGSAQMLGTFGSPTTAKSDCNYAMVIGSINTSGTIFANGVLARWKHVKIYEAGVLVRDFIPVRFTNEQGVSEGAMYDRLGVGGMNPDGSARDDGLFRNRGTGAFVIGSDK